MEYDSDERTTRSSRPVPVGTVRVRDMLSSETRPQRVYQTLSSSRPPAPTFSYWNFLSVVEAMARGDDVSAMPSSIRRSPRLIWEINLDTVAKHTWGPRSVGRLAGQCLYPFQYIKIFLPHRGRSGKHEWHTAEDLMICRKISIQLNSMWPAVRRAYFRAPLRYRLTAATRFSWRIEGR